MSRILLVLAFLLTTTAVVAFGQPVPTSPAHRAENQSVNVALGWRGLSTITLYEVHITDDAAFDEYEIFMTEETALETLNLEYSTTYQWRVRGLDGDGEPSTEWSKITSFTTMASDGIPQPVSPEDGATDEPRTVSLQWTSVDQSTGYEVEVASDNVFSDGEVISADGTSHTLAGLDYEQEVFWRVRRISAAAGPGEWSRYNTFTTEIQEPDPLSAPRQLAPANDATGQPLTVEILWGDVKGENIRYDLEIATDDGFSDLIPGVVGADVTGHEVFGLESETAYFWRVRAYNDETKSPWSSTWRFTTGKDSSAFLFAPGLLTPVNGSAGVPTDPLLTWDSVAGAELYEVQIAPDKEFASDSIPTLTSDSVSLQLTDLESGATYFWRARARDGNGTSAWSKPFRFLTKKVDQPLPVTPILIAPEHKESDMDAPVELVWHRAEHAVEYFIQLSGDGAFAGEEEDLSEFDTTLIVDELKTGAEYFWRVKAVNEAGESDWSETRSFKIRSEALPLPGLPSLISPANATQDLETPVALVWGNAPNASEYLVQVSSTGAFAGEETTMTDGDSTMTLTDLNDGQQYFWRVKGVNTTGEGEWTSAWSFSIREAISGVNSEGTAQGIRIWPVPAVGQLNIELGDASATPANVALYDGNGVQVSATVELHPARGAVRAVLSLNGIPSGLLYCRIVSVGGAVVTRPVLVIR